MPSTQWSENLNYVLKRYLRTQLGTALIEDKVQENHLRWFGCIQRRSGSASIRRICWIQVKGAPKDRGKSKKTWREIIRNTMKALLLTDDLAQDRTQKRRIHITLMVIDNASHNGIQPLVWESRLSKRNIASNNTWRSMNMYISFLKARNLEELNMKGVKYVWNDKRKNKCSNYRDHLFFSPI